MVVRVFSRQKMETTIMPEVEGWIYLLMLVNNTKGDMQVCLIWTTSTYIPYYISK